MDPSTLLSQLRDIHAPEPVSAWPLAVGWWLVIILAIVCISSLSYLILRKRLKSTWKRQALKSFKQLSSNYIQKPSTDNLLAINRLLKQAFSSAKNNRDYMHLCGSDWAEALKTIQHNGSSILHDQEISILSKDIYARQTGKLERAELDRISHWIKQLG